MEQSAGICFAVATSGGFPPAQGGLAVAAHRICHYLAGTGFDVHVVTAAAESAASSVTREDGLTVHRLAESESSFDRMFGYQRYIRQLDSKLNFDLFHAFFLPSLPPCIGIAQKHKNSFTRPVIASIRGSDATRYIPNPYLRPLLISALSKSNCWVTSVNQTYLDYVAESVDIGGRSSVVRNGAPVVKRCWQPNSENLGVVGISGQFRKVKDIPLLVRAYRRVKPELRRRLLLVGDFLDLSEERWSRALIQEFDISHEVEVTGFMPHAEAIAQLTRMNVYVQCSAFEGMPNALLEAAATGVPIVATSVGGVKEIFTDGHDALLVPHANPAALARAIERVLEDQNLALRLADNAAKLCERYSHERERREWVTLHQRLIAANGETRTAAGAVSS